MNRGIEHRAYPGSLGQASYMAQLAGAGRYVWNWAHGRRQDGWRAYKDGRLDDPPSFSFSLSAWSSRNYAAARVTNGCWTCRTGKSSSR